ncbi:MAG: hypothetical protein V2A65_02140 [Candidatus Omnitrophota bacterium]
MKNKIMTPPGTEVTIIIDREGKVIFQNLPEEMLEVAQAISGKNKTALRRNMWKRQVGKRR